MDERWYTINTKYSSLEIIAKVLYNPSIDMELLSPARYHWYNARERSTQIDTIIKNIVDSQMESEPGIYYKMITPNIAGKDVQFEYDRIFVVVVDDNSTDDTYDDHCATIEFIKCGKESTLFIFASIAFFNGELDNPASAKTLYKVYRALLPITARQRFYCFEFIDMLLPVALASPSDGYHAELEIKEKMEILKTIKDCILKEDPFVPLKRFINSSSFTELIDYLIEVLNEKGLVAFDDADFDMDWVTTKVYELN